MVKNKSSSKTGASRLIQDLQQAGGEKELGGGCSACRWGLTLLSRPPQQIPGSDWGSLCARSLGTHLFLNPPGPPPGPPRAQSWRPACGGAVKSRPRARSSPCGLGNRCSPLSLLDCSSVSSGGPLAPLCGLSSPPLHFGEQRAVKRQHLGLPRAPVAQLLPRLQPQATATLPPVPLPPCPAPSECLAPCAAGSWAWPPVTPRYFMPEKASGAWPTENPPPKATTAPVIVGAPPRPLPCQSPDPRAHSARVRDIPL